MRWASTLPRLAIGTLALLSVQLHTPPLPAAEDGPTPSVDEVVSRIVALQEEIEHLLASLPPELRKEVLRKLEELPPGTASELRPPPTSPAPAPPAPAEGGPPPPSTTPPESAAAPPPAPVVATGAATASDAAPGLRRVRSGRYACNTLRLFDSDGNGKVDGHDRYWRYLFLWVDANGDGRLQDEEVEHLFVHDVRAVDADLGGFTMKDGTGGDILREEHLVFELPARHGWTRGALVVDATRIQRFDGPGLLHRGKILEGFQPFRPGLSIRTPDGWVTELDCP